MENLYQLVREKRLLNQSFLSPELLPRISDITDVIVILGSSRSGSSLLHQILGQHPAINSLPGEDITYFRLHEYCQLRDTEFDDRLLKTHIDYETLAQGMLADAGKPDLCTPVPATAMANRLLLQWPQLLLKYSLKEINEWSQSSTSYRQLLQSLQLDTTNYENNLTRAHVDLNTHPILIEEPPFIEPVARKYSKKKRNILLLKSSSNAYRMNHILKLFPKASYHYILLNRNAEGTINGLYDGWNSSGFHSHNVSQLTKLNITDYPSKCWWKFDLPPGWINYTNNSLVEVAAFQWSSAYRNILSFLQDKNFATFDYDDFFEIQKLDSKLNQFFKSLDLPAMSISGQLPEIMTTEKPKKDRWLEKKDKIIPVTASKDITEVIQQLSEII